MRCSSESFSTRFWQRLNIGGEVSYEAMKLPRDFRDIGHCQSPSPRRSPAGLLYLDRAVKARPLAGGRCRPASGAIHSEDFDPLLRYAINLVLGSSRFLLASLPGPRPLNDCPGRLSRAEPFLAQRAGIVGHCTDTKRKLICALEALSVNSWICLVFGAPEEIRTPDPQIRSLPSR